MTFLPLYIDPGTGSALFSIAIGIAAAGYFLFRAVILKFRVIIFRRKSYAKSQNKFVIYAEDKRYWLFFQPILDEFETRQTEVHYLTSSEDDPVFTSDYSYIKGKYIGQGNKAYAYLNFLSAEFVLSTTPDLDVLQWKRSKSVKHYCHLIHAAGGSMLYRLFGLDYYDSILLSSESEINEIRYLESVRNLPEKQLVIVGNTFFDLCSKKIKIIPKDDNYLFTVLISPTWGPSGLLSIFGEKLIDPLVKTGWRIIIRPHPQSLIVEKPMIDGLVAQYKDNSNIEWDYNNENIYTLSKSDIMISDFSGIIFDYIFLFDKPVLFNLSNLDFRPLDAHCLNSEPSYIQNLRKIGMELDGNNFENIKETICQLSHNTELARNRHEVKNQMWQYKNESGKHIFDFMVNKFSNGEN